MVSAVRLVLFTRQSDAILADFYYLDAIYLKLRPEDQPAEGVLVCWGVTLEGRKILLGLALGSRESYESWLAFGRDMIGRGMRAPALVVADGAPGICKAVRELWPEALEQRCTVHALRNVTSKLPERHHQEVKARWWKAFDEARSPGEATRELQGIIVDYRTAYPSAMAVVERDLPALVAYLWFPPSTASESGPRISLRERSWRSAGAPRSSAAFPARPPRCHSSGPCWSSHHADGEA